ncbi:MAG TPA: LysR family transcriptional regulator [Candidatus Dormibacteraeota bacterium]|nr:LysR family transcriptional regulator [Candidatus Dormibacteraeota bacterium]
MNITLTQLRAFCAVAETRNFRTAAERLHLSQSGVSVQVAGLERGLRLALLDRRPPGWRLTRAGEIVLERARAIVDQGALLEREAAAIRSGVRGQFRLGATLSIADHSLSLMLSDYLRDHPEVRVSVRVQNTREIEHAVLAGELDVALIEGSLSSGGHLVEVPYQRDQMVVVCAHDHPFAERCHITREELLEAPLIAREPGSGSRALIEERLGVALAELNLRIELSSVRAIVTAVAAGMGVALLSSSGVAEAVAEGEVAAVDVDGVDLSRFFRMVHVEGGPRNDAARAFANHVRTVAALGPRRSAVTG